MRYLDGISFSGYAIVGALLNGVMNTDSSQPPRQSSEMAAQARFVKMALPEKVREDPWINRARASSHHKSIQRRESIVVSMLTPPRIAASEQPLARWQVTSFRSARFRPSNSAVRPAQYWRLIP